MIVLAGDAAGTVLERTVKLGAKHATNATNATNAKVQEEVTILLRPRKRK